MSAIEHVWDELGRRLLHQYAEPPTRLLQLQQRVVEQWEQIEMATVRHLFLGMSRRVAELMRRQG